MQQIKISVAWEHLYFRWPIKIFCIEIALSYALWYVFKWKIYLLFDIKINWVFCVLSANPRHGPGSLVTKRQPWPQEAQNQLHNTPGLKVGQKDRSTWSAAVALPSREEITERTTPSAGKFCVWARPPPRKWFYTANGHLPALQQKSSKRKSENNQENNMGTQKAKLCLCADFQLDWSPFCQEYVNKWKPKRRLSREFAVKESIH